MAEQLKQAAKRGENRGEDSDFMPTRENKTKNKPAPMEKKISDRI